MHKSYGYKKNSVTEGESEEERQFQYYSHMINSCTEKCKRYLYESDSKEQNSHKDFLIVSNNGVSKTIDAKGRKRFNKKYVDDAVLVEVIGNYGKKGWLYGNMDLISFNVNEVLYLCDKLELQKYIENLQLDYSNPIKTNDVLEYNKPYQRSGYDNKDITVWIPLTDLPYISKFENYGKGINKE